jgi:general secretion pathway protein F
VKIADKDKLALISNLNTMLNAGIPLLDAVEALLPDCTGASLKFLQLLHTSLNEGKTISDAMEKMPRSFDPIMINMVRASEEAGTLDATLSDMEESIKQNMAFKDELRASLVYPIFISVVFMGVLLLILLFVVPRISKVFTGLRTQIPPPTRFLMNASDFLMANYVVLSVCMIVFIVALVIVVRVWHKQVMSVMYRLPVISQLTRTIDLSRFCRSMGLMLHSGIPVDEALDFARSVVHKKEVIAVVDHMKHNVEVGRALSEGFDHKKSKIPIIMIRLTQTAEYSGSLESTMQKLADYFQTQVSRKLTTITALMEPVLIVIIGLATGDIMLAIIAPIYNLISNIHAR